MPVDIDIPVVVVTGNSGTITSYQFDPNDVTNANQLKNAALAKRAAALALIMMAGMTRGGSQVGIRTRLGRGLSDGTGYLVADATKTRLSGIGNVAAPTQPDPNIVAVTTALTGDQVAGVVAQLSAMYQADRFSISPGAYKQLVLDGRAVRVLVTRDLFGVVSGRGGSVDALPAWQRDP